MNMKKFLVFLLLMLTLSPAWAVFCGGCGKSIPEGANFCPNCGKAKPGSEMTPAPAPAPTPTHAPATSQSPLRDSGFDDSFLDQYEPVNRLESALSSGDYPAASRSADKERRKANDCFQKAESRFPSFNSREKKAHSLFRKKYEASERYLDFWRRSLHGPEKVRAAAEKERCRFIVSKSNEILMELRNNQSDPFILTRIEEMEKDLDESTKDYVITAPYLQLGNHRIPRGQPIWVMEIRNGLAKVMLMAESSAGHTISAWVPVYDLDRRSTWKMTYTDTPIQSPVVETEVIIIDRDSRWPFHTHGRHHRYYGWDHDDRRDRDDHPNRDAGHNDGRRH